MKLVCDSCGSDRVEYTVTGDAPTAEWRFRCGACKASWRPSTWKHEAAPTVVSYAAFEAFVDELRTAIAAQCSCSFAPCLHDSLRKAVEREQARSRVPDANAPGWDDLQKLANDDCLTIKRRGGKDPYGLSVEIWTVGNAIDTSLFAMRAVDLTDEDGDLVVRKTLVTALAELKGLRDG